MKVLTAIIDEALALERAGMTWSFAHVAAITGYSVNYIRHSDCPREHERTIEGVKRDRTVFMPAAVRLWKASLLKQRAG